VLAVLAFAAIGRSSHAEAVKVLAVLSTSAPFLVGLLAGWGTGRVWRAPVRLTSGWWAVAGAAIVGLVLRYLVTDRLPWTFVLVASVSLAVMLQSWRLVGLAVLHRRRRSI
jgi:predicted alpha/beta hydrolase